MVVSLRNCGIITSQANSKAVCKAPKGRFYPADAGIVRTFYHNLWLSLLRLRRLLIKLWHNILHRRRVCNASQQKPTGEPPVKRYEILGKRGMK